MKSRTAQLLLLVSFVMGCSTSDCRRKDVLPRYPEKTTDILPDDKSLKSSDDKTTVMVFKYDGSLQCRLGHPIPLEVMAKELDGLRILSKENKYDGLMHVQVCGASTGRANVYEIYNKDLNQALARGFQVWQFD